MKLGLRAFILAAMIAATLSGGTTAHAQTYPTRPISLVVPYTVGTVTDSSARMLATELSKRLGQPVIVQNQSGGVGTVGSQFVAKSIPDGYTLLITPPAPMTPAANLPYDPARAFVLIAQATVPSDRSPVPISVYAPTGTPPAAVARLVSAIKDSLATTSLQDQFATLGLQVASAVQDGRSAVPQKLEQARQAGSTGGQNPQEDALAAQLKAANAGNASAMAQLGARYETGKGVAQSYEQAVAWYRKAADAGDIAGMSGLGAMYYNGWGGLARDPAQARIWVSKAAAAGNGRAMNAMGSLYYEGVGGLPKDFAQALPWFEKAAAAGEPRAMDMLGILYVEGTELPQDFGRALVLFRKAADAGSGVGMYMLGTLYKHGQGVAQDYAEALSWYRRAADAGDANAMNQVGSLYENGQGVAKNDDVALSWYRKGAAAGSASAMYQIGYYYNAGRSVAKNDAESLIWFQKAAAKGDTGAIEYLKAREASALAARQAANAASTSAPAASTSDSGDSPFANALVGALLSQTAGTLAQSNTGAGSVLSGVFANLAESVQQGGSASSGATPSARTEIPGANSGSGRIFVVSRQTREDACATSKSLTTQAGLVPGKCVCDTSFNAFNCHVETASNAPSAAAGSTSAAGKLTTDQLHAIALQCQKKVEAASARSGNSNNTQYETQCKMAAFDLCIYQDTNHQVTEYNQEAKVACSVVKSAPGGSSCPSTCNAVAKLP